MLTKTLPKLEDLAVTDAWFDENDPSVLHVELPDELYDMLKELADENGITVEAMMLARIQEHLKEED